MAAKGTTREALLDEARRYAVDFSARRNGKRAVDALLAGGDERALGLVMRLADGDAAEDRALAALLCSRLIEAAPGAGRSLLFVLAHDRDPTVLAAAAEALKPVEGAGALAILRRLARHDDPAVRRGTAIALYGRSAPSAVRTLAELACDRDEEVRNWAVWGLADLPSPTRTQRTALRRWLKQAKEGSQLTEHVREVLQGVPQTRSQRKRDRALRETTASRA